MDGPMDGPMSDCSWRRCHRCATPDTASSFFFPSAQQEYPDLVPLDSGLHSLDSFEKSDCGIVTSTAHTGGQTPAALMALN